MWQSVEILSVFNTLNLKQIFWKTKTFFKKVEYFFLVESTKTENASLPYKTAISETNVKTIIEWWVQNGPITKNGVLPITTLFFWKFCFSLRTSYKELILCTNDLKAHIRTFIKRWSFIWRFFFSVSILKEFILIEIKELDSAKSFKEAIKQWKLESCLCRIGRPYISYLKGIAIWN